MNEQAVRRDLDFLKSQYVPRTFAAYANKVPLGKLISPADEIRRTADELRLSGESNTFHSAVAAVLYASIGSYEMGLFTKLFNEKKAISTGLSIALLSGNYFQPRELFQLGDLLEYKGHLPYAYLMFERATRIGRRANPDGVWVIQSADKVRELSVQTISPLVAQPRFSLPVDELRFVISAMENLGQRLNLAVFSEDYAHVLRITGFIDKFATKTITRLSGSSSHEMVGIELKRLAIEARFSAIEARLQLGHFRRALTALDNLRKELENKVERVF
jgi:hypothetical protein